MGWEVTETERIRVAGGAIYSTDGRLLAMAKHTLVTTDWGVPMGLKPLAVNKQIPQGEQLVVDQRVQALF
jgi:uncharacterized membrane protein affecting hemolysin expression